MSDARGAGTTTAAAAPVVDVRSLVVEYGSGEAMRRAVDDVSFTVEAGRTLAVVGESGAGKSTIAKVLTGLEGATSGRVDVAGEDRTTPSRRTAVRRRRAKQLQLVPQDPFTSIDPRQAIGSVLAEAVSVHSDARGAVLAERVKALLDQVGLVEHQASLTPKQLSGGQLQRVAIARALAAEPDVIVLDEAVSALDVSVQAQVLNLLRALQESTGVAYVFITHDLSVVRQIAHEALVLRGGRVVEHGETDDVLSSARDAYTRLLIASTPQPGWHPVRRSDFVQGDADVSPPPLRMKEPPC